MSIGVDRALSGRVLSSELPDELATGKAPRSEKTAQPVLRLFINDNDGQKSPLSQLAVPTPAQTTGTRQEAQAALSNIQRSLPTPPGNEPGFKLTVPTVERVSMEAMFLASTMLANQILGDVAELKGKALSIMTDKQDLLRKQEVDQIREQMNAAVEQQDKAKKAGILSVVFDWVVAAVEVVTGVAKIVGGVMSGNAMQAAGGAMDLMAGMAGLVKAMANTLALVDPENAEKYKKVADAAGKIQLAFEIAGAAIDITSAVRNAVLTKVVPKVVGKVLQEGADQAISAAIRQGSKTALSAAASQVGKKVAAEIGEQIVTRAAKELAEEASKNAIKRAAHNFGVNKMAKHFGTEAIEKMVGNAVEKVGKDAIKRGVELTAKEVTEKVMAEIRWQVMAALAKGVTCGATTAMTVTRTAVTSAQNITVGTIEKQKAELQKKIDQLVLDQQWTQNFFEFFEASKKDGIKKIKDLQDSQADIMQGAVTTIGKTASCQAQVAASMV
ncbi:type III secretion system translocon subunit SctE [Winslowiella iniecta]|uniref:type III secretion system translocon subunit SctE n=1 Tax=Winslowiella iniecta TaxID=1560201 RepID=UPI00069FE92F|nr:type III secretion system translocon subunit SctE [Winslowiella iniecta]